MNDVTIKGVSNTPINFQPTEFEGGTISTAGLTMDSGRLYPVDITGTFIPLPFSFTMWLNTGGNINVIPLSSSMTTSSGVLFKMVVGDFHRVCKGIVLANTTITDIVIDKLITIG